MEEAEKYLNTIRKALKNWDEWIENGNQILADGDKQLLMGWIEHERKKLHKLDAKKVKEEILQKEEGIGFRLKRLDDDFKMQAAIENIYGTRETSAQLSDDEANEAINAYRKKIEEKALDLIKAYDECKKYIKTKKITTKGKKKTKREPRLTDIFLVSDKEKLLKRLHELIDGKGGADVGSVFYRALVIENLISRKPTRAEFCQEFQLIGSWTAIHNYMNENDEKAIVRAANVIIFSE